MAVNLSARQFQQDDLAELIDETLRGTTLSADSLELEITESTLLDRDSSQRNAEILANRGVRLAIDDFGTGYSSLIYLKRFHVDTLKVDRSFVRGMLENPDDAQITATVIGLAKGLGIRSVAEGVEHPEQLAMLREQGCDMVQGFLVSKSLTGPDLLDWARGQRILDSECHWKRLA